jgi:predicted nucleic acid-binding protein
VYLDTSVLAKLFIAEPGSEECAAKVAGESIVSSELAYVEMFSAFLRKEREGWIKPADRDLSWTAFESRIADQNIILASLDGAIIGRARMLMAEVHPRVPIRTLDAVHLATYLSIVAGPLFTADRRMREAAELLGIQVVD